MSGEITTRMHTRRCVFNQRSRQQTRNYWTASTGSALLDGGCFQATGRSLAISGKKLGKSATIQQRPGNGSGG